jgi:hypothetical protein
VSQRRTYLYTSWESIVAFTVGGSRILISRVLTLSFLIAVAVVLSTALSLHTQPVNGAVAATNKVVSPTPSPVVSPTRSSVVSPTPSPVVSPTRSSVVSPTPSPVVSPTPLANQTGGGADPTLVGAAIIGIIAVGLMIGIYFATRRM